MSFNSILENGVMNIITFLIILGASLLIGFVFSIICAIKSESSKNFILTIALIPSAVAMVIILVNGQIGAGLAVAGAFSLVRFRSAPGTAREICIIFIAMATGLALGMGYIWYAAIFALVIGLIILLFSVTKLLSLIDNIDLLSSKNERILKIPWNQPRRARK